MENINTAFTNWIGKSTHATTHPSDQGRYHDFIKVAAKSDEYVDSEWLEEKLKNTPNTLSQEQINSLVGKFDAIMAYARYVASGH